jgi:hypothetical protein
MGMLRVSGQEDMLKKQITVCALWAGACAVAGPPGLSVYDMSVVLVATNQHVMTDKWTNIDTIWYYKY